MPSCNRLNLSEHEQRLSSVYTTHIWQNDPFPMHTRTSGKVVLLRENLTPVLATLVSQLLGLLRPLYSQCSPVTLNRILFQRLQMVLKTSNNITYTIWLQKPWSQDIPSLVARASPQYVKTDGEGPFFPPSHPTLPVRNSSRWILINPKGQHSVSKHQVRISGRRMFSEGSDTGLFLTVPTSSCAIGLRARVYLCVSDEGFYSSLHKYSILFWLHYEP